MPTTPMKFVAGRVPLPARDAAPTSAATLKDRRPATPSTAGSSVTLTDTHPRHSTEQAASLNIAGRHVYLIGIGGCGMSGLARMLRARGAIVRGSDSCPSPYTDALKSDGVSIGFDQSSMWLPEPCDLVVASAAIRPDHPQLLEADRRGIPHLNYAEALGRCMAGCTGICVAGTHGKSTTTAMLGLALADAGLDPNVIVGANSPQMGGSGFRLGSTTIPRGDLQGCPGLLVVEACEFNRSFHNYRPLKAAITSVEADHLDVYGSLEEVIRSFHEFARLIPPANQGGLLIIADKDSHRREVTAGLECEVQTIGWSPSCDWSVQYEPVTRRTGLVRKGRGLVAAWVTSIPGEHNAMNSATAAALAISTGADPDAVAASLSQFRGIDRRMQFLGEKKLTGHALGVRVYDDYGHHPTEVSTTLTAMREFERPEKRGGRLICVFQPHQHSRTRFLLDEFASAFGEADLVIVPHIYFVRDSIEEKTKVTANDLVDRLRNRGVESLHLHAFESIVEHLHRECRPGDLVVVMGAGPVDQIARAYLGIGG
ncbi:MAG: UDP-N-acetylmuramate--L-alanine ligase [Phycisphaerales bacterium]